MAKRTTVEKATQLGVDPGTASNRLLKDILFRFVQDTSGAICFRCSGLMTRDDFSIDHKEPWLHSDDPSALFFDLKNIAYSHLVCNQRAARKKKSKYTNPVLRRHARRVRNRAYKKKYSAMKKKVVCG